jgi:hypothetical protein
VLFIDDAPAGLSGARRAPRLALAVGALACLCGAVAGVRAQAAPAPAPAGDTVAPSGMSAEQLASAASNPTAPLTQLQLRDVWLPDISDGSSANALQLQPVVPIGPFHSFPHVQLMKLTLPLYVRAEGTSGLGDLQLFDLLTIEQRWGRYGVGLSLIFPTASDSQIGAGKWQAGPAAALIYTGWTGVVAGAVVQNPISFAGSPDRPAVSQLIIAPTVTFTLADGWFAGLSDFNWTLDWYDGAFTMPVGGQVGRVVRIGRQPVNISMEAGTTLSRPAGTAWPGWIIGIEITPLLNFHVGPGHVIELRGLQDL